MDETLLDAERAGVRPTAGLQPATARGGRARLERLVGNLVQTPSPAAPRAGGGLTMVVRLPLA